MSAMGGRSNSADCSSLERVKVYRLNDEGRWDDKGTGHISVEYLQRSGTAGLVVVDETDNATLLVHRILVDDIYRKQEDTIISWTDSEVGTELALSFQEAVGCSIIWDHICGVQRSMQFPPVGATENGSRPIIDELEHSGASQDDCDAFQDSGTEVSDLPPMELAALPQIVKFVAEAVPMDRDRIAVLILREQNYLRKLMELFKVCEDLENIEGLHMIFKIVKGIISLNDGHIFDIFFSDEYIMDVVGALEYDPEFPSRQDHRRFLKEQVVFKEAVPINDPTILSKIHQTYRIAYIKDVILPRALDDLTLSTINSIMLFNNMGVVSSLHNDTTFIKALFSEFKSPNTPDHITKELVFFLQELCNTSKNFQPSLRIELFSSLVREGLFEIVTTTLQSSDACLPLSGSDILIVILNHEPSLLRTFLVQQRGHTLFSLLVKGMLTPGEGGLQVQLLEIMRMLLDSNTMDQQQTDKSSFLDIFYEKYMDQLVETFTSACPSKGNVEGPKQLVTSLQSGKKLSVVSPEILSHLVELMCFCVRHHGFRIKYYVIRNNLVEKILRLTHRKEKYLVVAAVRLLRACVGLKDEFYYRYLVKNNLFEPVIQAFLANGSRYNLLNSAVLELIEFIRKASMKSLITHLVESYSEKFAEINYVDTFQQLKLRYDQLLEGPAANSRETGFASTEMEHLSGRLQQRLQNASSFSVLRERKDERALDKHEEDYFNDDSDDEDTASVGKVTSPTRISQAVTVNGSVLRDASLREGPFGLVDYEDDEDVSTLCNEKKDGFLERHSEGNTALSVPTSEPRWPATEKASFSKRKTSGPLDKGANDSAALKKNKQENLHGRRCSDWGSTQSREIKQFVSEKNSETKGSLGSTYGRSSQKSEEQIAIKENRSSSDCQSTKLAESSHLSDNDSSLMKDTEDKRAAEKITTKSDEMSDCGNGCGNCAPQVLAAGATVEGTGRLDSESNQNPINSMNNGLDSKPGVIDESREVENTCKCPDLVSTD